MKKLALTLTIAAVLAVGAQAQTNNGGNNGGKGIILGGFAATQCENVNHGIILGGLTGEEKKGGKGIILGGIASDCSGDEGILTTIWNNITGIILGG